MFLAFMNLNELPDERYILEMEMGISVIDNELFDSVWRTDSCITVWHMHPWSLAPGDGHQWSPASSVCRAVSGRWHTPSLCRNSPSVQTLSSHTPEVSPSRTLPLRPVLVIKSVFCDSWEQQVNTSTNVLLCVLRDPLMTLLVELM